MHRYETHVAWKRNGAKFTDMRYSRGHEWSFDGGVRLTASSAPSSIPVSYSVSEAVDPEEAPVAAASSCHMLTFRYLAAKRGFVIESYVDDAPGVLDKNPGKLAITRITFRPRIEFSGDKTPSPAELEALHRSAHEDFYIASSIKSEVVVDAS